MVGSAAERPLLAAVDALLDGIEIEALDTRIDDSHGASRDVDVDDGAAMKTTAARIPLVDGAVMVAAAGYVSRRDQDGKYRIAASLPAAANDLISAVALQQGQDGLAVADFSLADISVPGVNISSVRKGGGLIASSGTSVATPHMAGLLAPWWQGLRRRPTRVNARLVSGRLLASAGAKGFAPEVEITDRGVGVAGAPR